MNQTGLARLCALAGYRRMALLVMLSMAGALSEGAGFVLLVPLLSAMVGPPPGDGPAAPVSRWLEGLAWQPALGTLLLAFVALVVLRAVVDYARVMASARLAATLVDRLRERAFDALLAADWNMLARMRQSDNRAMLISEIDRTAIALDQFGAMLRLTAGLAAIGLAAVAISPLAALGGAAAALAVIAFYGGLRRRAAALGTALSRQYRLVHGLLEESLDGLRAIKSFGAEEAARARVRQGFRALRTVQLRFASDSHLARSLLQGGGAMLAAMAIWLAVERWQVSVIVVLPLVALFARALPQLGAVLDCWQNWAHAAPAIFSAEQLIREAEAAAESRSPAAIGESPALPRSAREIALDNVGFAHRPGHPALRGISLRLAAGETVAVIGPSGAGKSTLADILGGLLVPDSGQLLVGGIPVGQANRRAWRRQVAYVDQNPALFYGSVRDNLRWADPDADERRLQQVLELAAAGFVHALPGGLDCPIGEGGRQLSGGERQRIVLARALLRDPALLILDEAASALDSETDRAVAEAVAGLGGRMAIVVIGHRGALAGIAGRTVRLEQGCIVSDNDRSRDNAFSTPQSKFSDNSPVDG